MNKLVAGPSTWKRPLLGESFSRGIDPSGVWNIFPKIRSVTLIFEANTVIGEP